MSIFNNIMGSSEYDEKLVKQWISMYGALPRMQIKCLLNKNKDSDATNLIKYLVKKGELYEQEGGVFLALDPRQRKSERVIKALWVLIQYRDRVKPDEHYPAEFPSELYFLKDNQEYEIFVLNKGEEFKLMHLKRRENVRYIIVVPNVEASYITSLQVPDIEYIYATVSYGCSGEALVNFFSPTQKQENQSDDTITEEDYYEEMEDTVEEYCEENTEDFCDTFEEKTDEEEGDDPDVLTTNFDEEDDENV